MLSRFCICLESSHTGHLTKNYYKSYVTVIVLGVVTYTGAPDNTISGTLLFTTDEWTTANSAGATNVAGLKALLTPDTTSKEVLSKTWLVKFTAVDNSSTNTTLTFENCKLSVADISKSAEGGVKVDITVICPGDSTT